MELIRKSNKQVLDKEYRSGAFPPKSKIMDGECAAGRHSTVLTWFLLHFCPYFSPVPLSHIPIQSAAAPHTKSEGASQPLRFFSVHIRFYDPVEAFFDHTTMFRRADSQIAHAPQSSV